jgi:hypothetical protein
MTRRTNARVAGVTFLLYIATGLTSLALFNQATGGGGGAAAQLAGIARHETLVGVTILLTLLQAGYALVLGVTLHGLTRHQDPDLAVMALCCRAGEGLIGVLATIGALQLFAASTASAASGPRQEAAQLLGSILLKQDGWSVSIAATCFAAGSMLFSWLFLRARTIPVPLAWLGLVASVLLVVLLPLRLAGFLSGPVTMLMWLPMLVFELAFAFRLIVKGVAEPEPR